MIIFGLNNRYKTIDTGQFVCPRCGHHTTYERQHGRRYVTLYFIPVIPLGGDHDVIVCTHCGAILAPDVLQQAPLKQAKRSLADFINQLEPTLRYGRPIEYALTELTAQGIDRDIARQLVRDAIGTERMLCPDCSLTYADNVSHCADCNRPLEKIT